MVREVSLTLHFIDWWRLTKQMFVASTEIYYMTHWWSTRQDELLFCIRLDISRVYDSRSDMHMIYSTQNLEYTSTWESFSIVPCISIIHKKSIIRNILASQFYVRLRVVGYIRDRAIEHDCRRHSGNGNPMLIKNGWPEMIFKPGTWIFGYCPVKQHPRKYGC